MKKETWDKLEGIFDDAPMMKAESVPESELNEASSSLGFELTADYKEFVCRFGGATVGAYSVYGLRASETMGDDEASAFEVTERFKNDGWEGLDNALVVSSDHSGNPVYMKSNGEIWITDHDFGGASKIAESFEDYLLTTCLS